MNTDTKKHNKSSRLGLWASFFGLFSSRKLKTRKEDIEKLDFSANTQKTGLRFTESLRDFFRFHWLRGR